MTGPVAGAQLSTGRQVEKGTPTSVCELVKRIKGFKEGRTFVGDGLAGNLPALPPNGLPRQGQDRLLTTPAF